jgi:hypothetical protein
LHSIDPTALSEISRAPLHRKKQLRFIGVPTAEIPNQTGVIKSILIKKDA